MYDVNVLGKYCANIIVQYHKMDAHKSMVIFLPGHEMIVDVYISCVDKTLS